MTSSATCWTLLADAAKSEEGARERFARLYMPIVEAYLNQRWRGRARPEDVDDATQQVLLECLRPGGVLDVAQKKAKSGFRAFLYGVTLNIARRVEQSRFDRRLQQAAASDVVHAVPSSEDPASDVFDRGWATALAREAGERYRDQADPADSRAVRRVRLLELRFSDGLPIRTIAERWEADPAELHREYALARKHYLGCLRDVIRFHHPDSPANAERELEDVLTSLA